MRPLGDFLSSDVPVSLGGLAYHQWRQPLRLGLMAIVTKFSFVFEKKRTSHSTNASLRVFKLHYCGAHHLDYHRTVIVWIASLYRRYLRHLKMIYRLSTSIVPSRARPTGRSKGTGFGPPARLYPSCAFASLSANGNTPD